MGNNLINEAKSFFNDEVLNKLGATTGEDSNNVKSGIDAIIPTLFLGLQSQNPNTLSAILEQAKQYFTDFDFGNIFAGQQESTAVDATQTAQAQHKDLLQTIFGNNLSNLTHSVTNFLGLKSETVQKLLSIGLPAVFASLTNKGSNWNASQITGLLNDNQSAFASAVPSALGLAAFGTSFAKADSIPPIESRPEDDFEITHPVTVTETPVTPIREAQKPVTTPPVHTNPPIAHTHETVEEKKGAGYWWLLIPLLLIVGWLLFGKGCNKDAPVVASDSTMVDTNTTVVPVDTLNITSGQPSRESVVLKLPNGQDINAYTGGIEDNLIAFLQAGDYKTFTDEQLKEKWFDFDNLNFETGTATVLPESKSQLINLAAILKVFPDAKVKIGGYTDRTGNEVLNKQLSLDRANAVKNFLAEQGLGAQVLETEGYGSQFAKAEATAPEDQRVLDRRVSVSVRK